MLKEAGEILGPGGDYTKYELWQNHCERFENKFLSTNPNHYKNEEPINGDTSVKAYYYWELEDNMECFKKSNEKA